MLPLSYNLPFSQKSHVLDNIYVEKSKSSRETGIANKIQNLGMSTTIWPYLIAADGVPFVLAKM